MTPGWNEAPIALDELDDHLKALLRLKIREFVHLSPWFKDTPIVDPTAFPASMSSPSSYLTAGTINRQAPCPNKKHEARVRRHVRSPLHAQGS